MADSGNEVQLVLRAQCGDREALEALLRGIGGSLSRYVSGLVERWGTEDVLQNMFLQICLKLKDLREPKFFRAWVYQIASRESFRFLKRERRLGGWSNEEEPIEDIPAPPDTHIPELFSEMPALLDELSPASRAVILLHYSQDQSLEEIAAILEISVGTVKSRLAYGLSCLRKSMERKK